MSYFPLDRSLLESTLWASGTLEARVLWIHLLLSANVRTGIVESTIPAIARDCRLTIEKVEETIKTFMEPDRYSRTKENEGRRIEIVEDGILLLNYEKYQNKDYSTPRVKRYDERNPGRKHRATGGQRGATVGNDEHEHEHEQVKEKELKEKEAKASKSQSANADIRQVFDYWLSLFEKEKGPKPKLDKKRSARINARLKEGFTVEELQWACLGASRDEFLLAKGYTGIQTILRDAEAVERHIVSLSSTSRKTSRSKEEVEEQQTRHKWKNATPEMRANPDEFSPEVIEKYGLVNENSTK